MNHEILAYRIPDAGRLIGLGTTKLSRGPDGIKIEGTGTARDEQ